MAGGIDWLRWHHGSVTDPKFQLVARKSGASLPDVLAVWASILEKASAATERGIFGDIDAESLDCLFGFPDGRTADVLAAFDARNLTSAGRIVAWEVRQPKREREDNSAERVKAFREKKRHVTPSNTSDSQETPREEKRREELTAKPEAKSLSDKSLGFEDFWAAYPVKKGRADAEKKWRAKKLDPMTGEIIADVLNRSHHDTDWLRGYIPHGSTYVNGEGWRDGIKTQTPSQASAPGRTMQGLTLLEGMKHGLADARDSNGFPKIALSGPGTATGR